MNDFKTYPIWDENVNYPEKPLDIDCIEKIMVQDHAKDSIKFLHDSCVTVFNNRIYVAWYNSTEGEIVGKTFIRCRYSPDEGKTWSEPFVIVEDKANEGCHYVPVNLFSQDDTLFALITKMVSHDRPLSYDLYRMRDDKWEFAGNVSDAFISNTAPILMNNGNYIISGRIDKDKGGYPRVPAVLISNPDKITEKWECIPFYDVNKPEYLGLSCPETTIIVENNFITAFTRNDNGKSYIFTSEDYGLSWSEPFVNPMPITNSKISAYKLSNGKRILIYNGTEKGRALMLMAVGEKDSRVFNKVYRLAEGYSDELKSGPYWCYACPYEHNGILYISCTVHDPVGLRSCALLKIPVDLL